MILLVNPPIYDFAAHDFWLKPYGLLRIGRLLKENGREVLLFDFLEETVKRDRFGRGKFPYVEVEKPKPLKNIRRKYKRYGKKRETFINVLKETKPEAVFIETSMTYWYPGVKEVVDTVREIFKSIPVVIGGVYATLLKDHAEKVISPDIIVVGDDLSPLRELSIDVEKPLDPPLFELYRELPYGVTRLTEGCTFKCPYCASPILKRRFIKRNVDDIMEEFDVLRRLRVKDVAFYDDALLLGIELLGSVEENFGGVFRFHTPNALHGRLIDEEVAKLLREMGTETVYIGFETQNPWRQISLGDKIRNYEAMEAVENLLKAGYKRSDITLYLFMGLPGQPPEEVEEGIRFIGEKLRVRVMLSEFSPIPGTPMFEEALKIAPVEEPLLQNPTVFPILYYGEEEVNRLKDLKNKINRALISLS